MPSLRGKLPLTLRRGLFRMRQGAVFCRDIVGGCAFDRPIFVVGCGRSGTTLVGQILGRHPQVCSLNEERRIWFKAFPQTYVWNFPEFPVPEGRAALDATDAGAWSIRKLRAVLHNQLVFDRKARLVEKTPINALRIPFIERIFPNAIFVHVLRDGRAVAASIERRCEEGDWFVLSPYYWECMAEYAGGRPELAPLVNRCETFFEKGLLQWRMHVEAVREQAMRLNGRLHEIRYEDLVRDPWRVVCGVLDFSGLSRAPAVEDFCRSEVHGRSQWDGRDLTENEQQIAGETLRSLGYA